MRQDPAEQRATQEEGRKDQAKDLEHMNQPVKKANQPKLQTGKGDTAAEQVRSQDPNFGSGHH